MGCVYRVFDERLGRRVALKIVRPSGGADGTQATARLVREARAAAALGHPNVISIFDVGESDGAAFVVMELVSGKTLREYVGDASVPVERRVQWLIDVARALGAAHKAGLVHRDIKPDNVMINDEGVVKVLDFGIARRSSRAADPTAPTESNGIETITQDGVVVGTPLYMAPEQLRGEDLDGRADQFAWGVVASELLTGALPWKRPTDPVAVIAAILGEVPERIAAEGVPQPIADAVARALAKSRDDRFPSMGDLVVAIERGTSAGMAATQEARSIAPPRRPRRALFTGVALVALVSAVAAYAWRTSRAHEQPATSLAASSAASTEAPPKTTNAEALTAYRAALSVRRRGDVDAYRKHLGEAIKLDPSFAAARLRMALAMHALRLAMPGDARPHAEIAGRERDALSPRDRQLLTAVEPAFTRDPGDYREAWRRLAALGREVPNDAEVALFEGQMADYLLRFDDAEAAFRRALTADPGSFAALGELARMRVWRGEDRIPEIDACADGSPPVPICLTMRMFLSRVRGRCDDMARDGRAAAVVEGDSYRAWAFVAEARASRGAAEPEIVETLRISLARIPDELRPRLESGFDANRTALFGRFDEALVAAGRRESLFVQTPDAGSAGGAHHFTARLMHEVGDDAGAAKHAASFRARSAAWGAPRSIVDDMRPRLLAYEVHGGLVTRDEQERLVRGWENDWRGRLDDEAGPHVAWWRWAMLRAGSVETEEEARAALSLAPPGEPGPSFSGWPLQLALAYGRTLRLAGRVDEAIPQLSTAMNDCDGLQGAPHIFQARLDLGDALASKGDKQGACDAWRDIVVRWGNAKPRSVTADAAKARAKKLNCGY